MILSKEQIEIMKKCNKNDCYRCEIMLRGQREICDEDTVFETLEAAWAEIERLKMEKEKTDEIIKGMCTQCYFRKEVKND